MEQTNCNRLFPRKSESDIILDWKFEELEELKTDLENKREMLEILFKLHDDGTHVEVIEQSKLVDEAILKWSTCEITTAV